MASSALAAHSRYAMSFSAQAGLAHVPAMGLGGGYGEQTIDRATWQPPDDFRLVTGTDLARRTCPPKPATAPSRRGIPSHTGFTNGGTRPLARVAPRRCMIT